MCHDKCFVWIISLNLIINLKSEHCCDLHLGARKLRFREVKLLDHIHPDDELSWF